MKKKICLFLENFNYYFFQIYIFKYLTKVNFKYKKFRTKYILKNIIKKCNDVIKKYDDISYIGKSIENTVPKIIWILWWQGIDNAPDIVKNCVNSIKKNASDYEIRILSSDNVFDYLDIDNIVYQKFLDKKISFASFSDILRVKLLYDYGGIWLDSTIFLANNIPNEILEYDFYSVKFNNDSFVPYVTDCKWGIYFLSSKKNNILMKFVYDVSVEYFHKSNYPVDYFLTDHIFYLAYSRYSFVRDLIDCFPKNNLNVENLAPLLNNEYDSKLYNTLLKTNFLFKLTYKINISSGNTFYNVLLGGYDE